MCMERVPINFQVLYFFKLILHTNDEIWHICWCCCLWVSFGLLVCALFTVFPGSWTIAFYSLHIRTLFYLAVKYICRTYWSFGIYQKPKINVIHMLICRTTVENVLLAFLLAFFLSLAQKCRLFGALFLRFFTLARANTKSTAI